MKNWIILALTIICVALIYFLLLKENNNQISIVNRIDTVVKIIPQKEIKIVEAKPKIKYIRDTLIQTSPFVVVLDTIIQRDTIFASYQFPENIVSLNLRGSSDTIKVPQIVFERQKIERNWYEIGAAVAGGFILGLILGK